MAKAWKNRALDALKVVLEVMPGFPKHMIPLLCPPMMPLLCTPMHTQPMHATCMHATTQPMQLVCMQLTTGRGMGGGCASCI